MRRSAAFWERAAQPGSLAILAAATLAAFAGVLRSDWILLDDPDYVLANPHVNQGLTTAGLRWMLLASHAANYHPLTTLIHMLNVQFFGLNPVGHHAVSLVLHVSNAVLLAVALSRLTGAWWRSVLVAAFFALSPLRVESVAWASELKDVLSGLFFMLTLLAYAHWVERPARWRYAVVVISLGLGLLAKPMLVTVPFVLVLLDIWPLGRLKDGPPPARERGGPCVATQRGLAGLLAEKWLLLVLAAASSTVTFLVQHASGAMASIENIPFASRAANASLTYWRYLGLTVWPHGLLPFYTLHPHAGLAPGALAALAIVVTIALVAGQAGRRPHLLVGWAWYLGMLVPVIGLVQVGMQAYADRYTYLTVTGVLIAVVWAASEWWPSGKPARTAVVGVVLALLAASGVATARQVARWRSNRTLFSYTLAQDPSNFDALYCLGTELLQTGQIRGAMDDLNAALRIAPGFADAHLNLGNAFSALGRYEEGIAQFREAIRLGDGVRVRHNLGLTLMKQGRTDDAIAEYEAGLRIEPDHFPSLVELGAALGIKGRMDEAEVALRQAAVLAPRDVRVRRLLAVTLTNEGRVEDAIEQYRVLLRQAPDDLDALNNIAWIRATHADPGHRNGAEAVRLAEQARGVSRQPVAILYSTLAAAYAEAGRFPAAIQAGRRAVALAAAEGDTAAGVRFAQQLGHYQAGKPFHFAR